MTIDERSANPNPRPSSRRLATPLAITLYVIVAAALAVVLAVLVALAKWVPGFVLSGGLVLPGAFEDSIDTHIVGTLWLLPLTLAGTVIGGIVSRTEDLRPQTGMIVVTIGAAVGAVTATQLMPPAGVVSHDLAAWAVLAPAAALLLAIAPWPGALVHPDGGRTTALEQAEARERAAADRA